MARRKKPAPQAPPVGHPLGPLREHWERSKLRGWILGFAGAALILALYALLSTVTPLDFLSGEDCVTTQNQEHVDARGVADDVTTSTSTTTCSPGTAPITAVWASLALALFLLAPEVITRLPGVKISALGTTAEIPSSPEQLAAQKAGDAATAYLSAPLPSPRGS